MNNKNSHQVLYLDQIKKIIEHFEVLKTENAASTFLQDVDFNDYFKKLNANADNCYKNKPLTQDELINKQKESMNGVQF